MARTWKRARTNAQVSCWKWNDMLAFLYLERCYLTVCLFYVCLTGYLPHAPAMPLATPVHMPSDPSAAGPSGLHSAVIAAPGTAPAAQRGALLQRCRPPPPPTTQPQQAVHQQPRGRKPGRGGRSAGGKGAAPALAAEPAGAMQQHPQPAAGDTPLLPGTALRHAAVPNPMGTPQLVNGAGLALHAGPVMPAGTSSLDGAGP